MNKNSRDKRVHIQALRGYAVLLVVLYHSGIQALGSGFLGVDIFFVISGFLITGLIVREKDADAFSLKSFYFRRVKRLLPAAYATLIVTVLVAPFLLTAPQMSQFQEQVIGAVTFSANVVLLMQSGYFDAAATTKPLMHFWSLAVEEQYYFLVPWLFILLGKGRGRTLSVYFIVAASLIYCFWFADERPSEKFYLIHTRAWELGIGSIGALSSRSLYRTSASLCLPAIVTLLVVPFLTLRGNPPNFSALAVCISTLIVILGLYRAEQPFRMVSIPIKVLAFVGDFSYSLYLIHWPILVFMRSGYFDQSPPPGAFVGTFLLSLVLAYLLYRFVEQPFRSAKLFPSWRSVSIALASSFCVLALPSIFQANAKQKIDFAHIRRPNYGLAQACDQKGPFHILPVCRTAERPKVLVWGDSHAMHLLPALEDSAGGVIQATRSACAPFLGIAPYFEGSAVYSREAAQSCIEFNDSVMAYLEANSSIKVVVLAAALSLYNGSSLLQSSRHEFLNAPSKASEVAHAASQTISKIRELGKKVVIVESPPYGGFNIGSCLERRASGMWSFGEHADCTFSNELRETVSASEIELMRLIVSEANIASIGFVSYLCSTGTCQTSSAGVSLYVDGAHLTYDGARYLGKQMNLSSLLMAAAR